VTRPSTPDCWQGAKAPAADPPATEPPTAGWAQGGAQEPVVGAADGQGGGGQARLGGIGSTEVVAGAGSAEGHGGGQE
jgi:hypothetical protein